MKECSTCRVYTPFAIGNDNLMPELLKLSSEIEQLTISVKQLTILVNDYSNRINKLNFNISKTRTLANNYLTVYNQYINSNTTNLDCSRLINKYNLLMAQASAMDATRKRIQKEHDLLKLLVQGNSNDIYVLENELRKKRTDANVASNYNTCIKAC